MKGNETVTESGRRHETFKSLKRQQVAAREPREIYSERAGGGPSVTREGLLWLWNRSPPLQCPPLISSQALDVSAEPSVSRASSAPVPPLPS